MQVSIYWIPISILLCFLTIYIIIRILISRFINNLKSTLKVDMHKICEQTYNPTEITKTPLSTFNQSNAYSFYEVCNTVSSWAECKTPIALIPSFSLLKTLKGIDPAVNKSRNLGLIMHSQTLDVIVICFAGSVHVSEWIDDLDFSHQKQPSFVSTKSNSTPAPTGQLLVQKAQCEMYESMRDDINSALSSVLKPTTQVYCIGHSLGGVIASLCFLDLIINQPQFQSALYTFGSPRTGNIEFANTITQTNRSFRIVNTEDIIPTLPLPVVKSTVIYEHFGQIIPFTLNTKNLSENHTIAYEKMLKM